MDVLMESSVLFLLALSLAFLVERALEVIKCIYEVVDGVRDYHVIWTRRAAALRDKLERRLQVYQYVSPQHMQAVLRWAEDILLEPGHGHQGVVPTVCGDLVRAFWVKVALKILGTAIGLALALGFGIDLVALWRGMENGGDTLMIVPTLSGTLMTGVAIGLGSGTVHKIITAMERKKKESRSGR